MSSTARRKAPCRMTVDEFIAWTGDDRWELVDGEPRAMAPASATHGIIQARCAFLLNRHLLAGGRPFVAATEPCHPPSCPVTQQPASARRRRHMYSR